MVLGNVLQNAFNVVDMIFVGRLGAQAIAAVALCGILMQITWTLLVGLAIGAIAMVSRFFGAGDTERAADTAAQSLALGVCVAMFLAALALAAGGPILGLMGAEGAVLDLALGYLRIVFVGSFGLILFFLCSSIMRGLGDAVTPMFIMTGATALNIALDPLLIFGIWIFPEMGVRGAAIATVIAQVSGMTAAMFVLSTGRTRIRLGLRRFRPDGALMGRVLRLAGPGTLQGVSQSAASFVLMRIVSAYGVAVVAGYGIGLRLDLIAMMPGWALGAAASALVGQNLGANQPRRAEIGGWIACGMYATILLVVGSAFYLFAPTLIEVFNPDPAIVGSGSAYLRVRVLSYLLLAPGIVIAGALNGAGDPVTPMVMRAVSLLGIQLALAWWLPRLLGGDPLGVWIAVTVAFAAQGMGVSIWFLLGRWKHKQV
jgi:putative MATE family efflux protein